MSEQQRACRVPQRHEVPPASGIECQQLPGATREEAYAQGEWAYAFGKRLEDNPYWYPADQYNWWSEGWYASEADDGG